MNIEEIKNDINQLDSSKCCNEVIEHCCIDYKSVMEILDKYNNQQSLVTLKDFENVSNKLIDYQNAWEELKYEYISGESKQFENNIVKHIEQKYNLGGE